MAFTFDQASSAAGDIGEAPPGFRQTERLVVAFGAGGLGAIAGVGATLAFGALEPWVAAAIAAPVYFAALYLAERCVGETWRERGWPAFAMGMLLLAALAAWPLMAFYGATDARLFWGGPAAALVMLAGVIVSASGRPRQIYRASGLAFLIALLAANQSFLAAVGV